MAEEIKFRGKTIQELKKMDFKEFLELLPARQRRTLKRGFTPSQKILLAKIKKANLGIYKKKIRTQCRDLSILPEMVGLIIYVHNGKEFVPVSITIDMLGHSLGEFNLTRKKVAHSAPGIGATKSSAAMSVK